MPYSERTFLLLGIGITLIGVGWWVLTHVSFEAEVQLAPAAPVTMPLPADAVAEDAAEGEAAPELPAEGEVLTEPEAALPLESETLPAPSPESMPTTGEVLEGDQLESTNTASPLPTASELATDTTSNDGQVYPLPESSVAPPDAGRDAPIQMMPLRTEPATHVTAPETDGALPEE